MATRVHIEGTHFFINDKPTYEGVTYRGKPVEGLLFNSRMVQAIFDDENPRTAVHWRYPDTDRWDPERNTDEFCAALSEYRRYGLLAVTVGLQGGGAIYTPDVYDHYVNSAFAPDGTLKPPYFKRLQCVLEAADAAGLVVIVNYFYWKQAAKLEGKRAIRRATEEATDWLLQTDRRNILVDVMNEIQDGDNILDAPNIHQLVEIVQQTTLDGRRLLVGTSVHPKELLPPGQWQKVQDFYMPHGNDYWADKLRIQLRRLKESKAYTANPRPILINEDSIHLDSLEVAVSEHVSWGFYCQGYGCGFQHGRFDWSARDRETYYQDLSGYQTPPVNWGINTPIKQAFFDRVKLITGGS